MTTLTALVQLGRSLRDRPAKPAGRASRIGDLYLAAGERAAVYRALYEMAAIDEDEATGELACHLHDEGGHLEDAEAEARMAWAAWVEMQPEEAA